MKIQRHIPRIVFNLLLISLLSLSSASQKEIYQVKVYIKNIRNSKGRIQLQVYKNQESFKKEIPWKSTTVSKSQIKNNALTYTFKGLPKGIYGVALLDDENCNTKMDYGWLLPNEGFGFSDYYHSGWSKPNFNDFKFYLDKNKSVTMDVRYL